MAADNALDDWAHALDVALAHIVADDTESPRYRRYVSSYDLQQKAHLMRQIRGRKRFAPPQGRTYDLDAVFEDLNLRFFHGLLARPRMSWSSARARNSLGHYDPAHNAIVVSRIFDHPRVPRYAIEYLVYHEMLHLKHPVRMRGLRRCVHSREFKAEEALFPQLAQALAFIKRLPSMSDADYKDWTAAP